jgi:phosphoribosylanthranilate isomerase
MTWVKVCGLRTPEDAEAAAAAGADAIGVVFVPTSPRSIAPDAAGPVLEAAGRSETVILTIDLPPSELLALALRVGADGVQPYGAHVDDACAAAAAAGLRVLRPVPASGIATLELIPDTQMPLIDHRSDGRLGGTGQRFDWSVLDAVSRDFVLAGGLTPDNVADAVRTVGPWGVDASSGLESAPGVKDPARIRAYVEAVRAASIGAEQPAAHQISPRETRQP